MKPTAPARHVPGQGSGSKIVSWEGTMDRRQTLKLIGGAAAIAGTGLPSLAFAEAQKEMVTVVKIAGIPWFNAVEKVTLNSATAFHINPTIASPPTVYPAQPVNL